jgi:hypothetical protein
LYNLSVCSDQWCIFCVAYLHVRLERAGSALEVKIESEAQNRPAPKLNGGFAVQTVIGDELWNSMKARDCLARSCRLDQAAWLPVMAADDTFQPESAEKLQRKLHDHLCKEGGRKLATA